MTFNIKYLNKCMTLVLKNIGNVSRRVDKKSKSNVLLYSLYSAEACSELVRPISAPMRPGNTDPFEEMLQWWRAVGNFVPDLTDPRFEPQTSLCRDKRVTARPTGRYKKSRSIKIAFH